MLLRRLRGVLARLGASWAVRRPGWPGCQAGRQARQAGQSQAGRPATGGGRTDKRRLPCHGQADAQPPVPPLSLLGGESGRTREALMQMLTAAAKPASGQKPLPRAMMGSSVVEKRRTDRSAPAGHQAKRAMGPPPEIRAPAAWPPPANPSDSFQKPASTKLPDSRRRRKRLDAWLVGLPGHALASGIHQLGRPGDLQARGPRRHADATRRRSQYNMVWYGMVR